MRTVTLTIDQARRMALGAQGFADRRPTGRIDVRHFRRLLTTLGVIQIDSVNVLARAHYLPAFARLGSYSRPAFDDFLWRSREAFEYWGHEASFIPVSSWPLFAHRMVGGWHWQSIERLAAEHPGFVQSVLDEVGARGPLAAGDLDEHEVTKGTWWDWGKAKLALEWLFLTGNVTVAERRNFVRRYDLPDRVLPAAVLSEPGEPEEEARRRLLVMAARSVGVGTAADLADYYRIGYARGRPLVEALAVEGALKPVEVAGWNQPAFAHPDSSLPRRIERCALLSPFDPVVWFRPRAEMLFEFRYRIEIYTPAHKRVHGYYVMPILHGNRLVGRVDLKADRHASELLVRGAYAEPHADRGAVSEAVASELALMADWLELGSVKVEKRGDLAVQLARAL
jgi:uncharacterized protein YcaQ